MTFNSKRTCFGDVILDIWEDVYEPAEDSFLFAENLEVDAGAIVLDVGTGCGLLSVLAAKKALAVVAVDINPYALRCAQENGVLNNMRSKIDFIQSDLLTALHKKAQFDLVLFNAPYLPTAKGETDSWIGRSWAGGVDGREVIDRFISQIPFHLKKNGRVMLMQSTLTNVEATLAKFRQHNLKASIKAERALPFFEKLTLIQAEVKSA